MAENIFDHNDGGIHNDAEIHGAYREQVGRLPGENHQDHAEGQRDRNGRRHHHGAAQIAEKEILNEKHQEDAKENIVKHRLRGSVNEFPPVIKRRDVHALRENARPVHLIDRALHALDNFQTLFAMAHEHDAFHHIRVLVAPGNAQTRRVADLGSRHVLE